MSTATMHPTLLTTPVIPSAAAMQRLARVAGALYVALFVLGPFVFLYGKAAALVPGDPAATAANLASTWPSLRVGMAIEATIFLIEVALAAIMFVLFRQVGLALSAAAAFARLGEAILQAVNLMTSALMLFVITGAAWLGAFSPEQRDALVTLFLNANYMVVLVWGMFFGFHLLLLGWLVYRSRFLPRFIGILLGVAAVGYLAQSFGTIVWPDAGPALSSLVVALAVPGELVFTMWLLVKGVRRSTTQHTSSMRAA